MLNTFFRVPFATAGDKAAVPEGTQPDGSVSYNTGWTPDYELPYSNPNSKDIPRDQSNQLAFAVTTALREYQTNGVPDWIDPTQNLGVNFPYPIGARVRYTNGFVYESLVAANAALPTLATAWQRIVPGSGGTRIRSLLGQPNAGTPNTQYDFNALEVTMRSVATGGTIFAIVGSLTNNILLAGPVAGGRDQAGAFGASTWVHFWYISDGATTAVLSSASATAPTLPAGYTHQAYIGAVWFAGGILTPGFFRGSWFTYRAAPVILAGGTSTLRVAISLANVVPPNGLQHKARIANLAITSNGAGTYNVALNLETEITFAAYQASLAGTGAAGITQSIGGFTTTLPNVGAIQYFLTPTTGTGQTATLGIDGYQNPNGGE